LCLLGFEVISSQFGVVNLEQDVGIVNGGTIDLKRATIVGVGLSYTDDLWLQRVASKAFDFILLPTKEPVYLTLRASLLHQPFQSHRYI